MADEWGIVPCGICKKWVRSDIETKDENGAVVHPPCLRRECDFCANPKKLPVGLYLDAEADDSKFMCDDCKKIRRISEPPEHLMPKGEKKSIKENLMPADLDSPAQYILSEIESEVGILWIDTVLPNGAVNSWYDDEDAVMDYWDEQDGKEE